MTVGSTSGVYRRPVRWAFLSYVGLTLLLFWRLIPQIGSALPSDAGDPVLNTWILWWNTQAFPLSEQWWSAPAFFPVADTLAFSENLLGLFPISGPVQWLSGNPVLAYNVTFLLSFPLSGLAAFLLGRELTGRDDASWIAGLVYAFAPYRMDHFSQIQVLSWYWVPVILLALHRYIREGRTRWLVLFGVAYLFQGLVNGYLFLFVPVLVGLWVLWFVPLVRQVRVAGSIALAGALAGIVALPVLLRYQAVHDRFGFERSLAEMSYFSGDLTAILSAPRHVALWGWMDAFHGPEAQLFPGLTVVCLLIFGAVRFRWPRAGAPPRWIRKLRVLFATVSGIFLLLIVSRLALGPWALTIFGTDVSVAQFDKPFSIAMLFLTALALVSPTVLAARARRSVLGFYLLAVIAMWILTWGPFPTIFERDLIEHAPYSWLRVIPGFEGLRVPARFWMLGTACLAAAAGLVLARVLPAASRLRSLAVGLVACGVLADGWVVEMPVSPLPKTSTSLVESASGAVLELPLGWLYDDLEAMYRSIGHGRAVVNGYSGHTPAHYPALRLGLAAGDGGVLTMLSELGVREVLVNRTGDAEGVSLRFVSSYPGARLIHETPDESLYRLPVPPEALLPKHSGKVLPVVGLTANVNPDAVGNAIDGDLKSRWESGPQLNGHYLVADLGAQQMIRAIQLALGPFMADYPRDLQIAVSDDGIDWRLKWRGPTAARAIAAAIRSPVSVEIDIPCDRCQGRFVRLSQRGQDPVYYWSIAELRILGVDGAATLKTTEN